MNNSIFLFLLAIFAFMVLRNSSRIVQVIQAVLLCLYLLGITTDSHTKVVSLISNRLTSTTIESCVQVVCLMHLICKIKTSGIYILCMKYSQFGEKICLKTF
jgi:uncharacterized membrane protein